MHCMHVLCPTETLKPVFVSNDYFDADRFIDFPSSIDIADVSHFVHADTPMDSEAASRGTTVYLVDQRIDMLPSLLGTNLCSLRPHVERLAFSAIWVRHLDSVLPGRSTDLSYPTGIDTERRDRQRPFHQIRYRLQNGVYVRRGTET